MAGRASIVGAAATHVGKVREHNEDAHFIDVDLGVFLVCDGMGGHAAGEVASELAIRAIRNAWASEALADVVDQWLERGTADTKKRLLEVVRAGALSAHDAILAEADRDDTKSGMGTTLVGAMVVGGELVFAHAGDSRAYLVRDGISMQLTEDHTLLARLLAAGIDVDVSGEGSRFRSMLTNALGIGDECKVSTFIVPLADGDRFLLCSDGISEYVPENEVGEILSKQPSPARAAQRLIDLALERGGGDNATAVVVRVLEAGETPLPAEQRKKDDLAIGACALWGKRVTPQQRLRALRIAIPRDHNFGEKLPPHALGDRVAWIIVEGELVQDGVQLGPGALVYPESLVTGPDAAPPDRDALAITRSDVRALAIRADDFRELCDDDGELGETLLDSLAAMMARRKPREPAPRVDPRGQTDPQLRTISRDVAVVRPSDPELAADERDRAATVPDDPGQLAGHGQRPSRLPAESPIISPAPSRPQAPHAPSRPSPPPPRMSKATPPGVPTRPTPPPARLTPPPGPAAVPGPSIAAPPPSAPPPPPTATQPSSAPPAPAPASAPPVPASAPPVPAAASTTQPPSAPPAPASAPPVPAAASTTQPPSRPSPVPAAASATQPPSRPSPPPLPPAPPSGRASQPSSSIGPPPAPPPAPPPSRPSQPIAQPASRQSQPPSRPSQPPPLPAARPPARPTPPLVRAEGTPQDNPVASKLPPRGFAPALSPPLAAGEPASKPSAPAVRGAGAPRARTPSRPPTDPEIETYLEIEADLPPESGIDPDLESELALSIALSGDLEAVHESVSITIEEGTTRVIETVTETSSHTLTLTVTEPVSDLEQIRPRAITADDGAAVSGTISIPEERAPRRARARSEGD